MRMVARRPEDEVEQDLQAIVDSIVQRRLASLQLRDTAVATESRENFNKEKRVDKVLNAVDSGSEGTETDAYFAGQRSDQLFEQCLIEISMQPQGDSSHVIDNTTILMTQIKANKMIICLGVRRGIAMLRVSHTMARGAQTVLRQTNLMTEENDVTIRKSEAGRSENQTTKYVDMILRAVEAGTGDHQLNS